MSEGRGTKKMAWEVQRPLLCLLGCCWIGGVIGDWAGQGSPWIFAGLGLATMLSRRLRRAQVQGLAWPLLLAFVALASARRTLDAPAGIEPTGIWRTLYENDSLVGSLEGLRGRYELPRGSVRDGELLQLLPSRTALPPARGYMSSQSGQGPAPIQKVHADEIRRLAPAAEGNFLLGRQAWRNLRKRVLARVSGIPDPAARGLAAALLFGDRGKLRSEFTDLFTRTGTRHALAVSGLHVGLVASLWIWPLGSALAWLLRRLWFLPKAVLQCLRPELLRILLLLSFIPLAGAGAPVMRAALALGWMQAAELLPGRGPWRWKRRPDALSLWAFAGLCEWCAQPAAFDSISMQLSYLATLGLILLTTPSVALLRRCLPGRGQIAPVWPSGQRRPPWLRIPLQKACDWLLTGLAASMAASLATLPLVWYTFGEWSLTGPVATLWILPWLAAFLGLAWLQLLYPCAWFEWGLERIASSMEFGLEFFDAWPGTPVPLPLRPQALLWIAGLGLLLAAGRRHRWSSLGRRTCLGAWGLAILPWWNGARSPELYVADVGHGTAAVVRLPGAGTWLFDAGSRDRRGVARQAIAPLLRWLDVGQLHMALSHGEADHAGALPWLIERFPPVSWLGALPAQLAERLPHASDRFDLEQGRLEIGDAGSGLALLRGMQGTGNEGSRSLEVRSGGLSWLLCGDAEGDGLARQLRAGSIRGPYDVVLFPHHGSETPWLEEFLAAARPREVWFSAAGRPAVADELDRRGIPWRSTGRDGPLHWRE